ncbi:MAG: AAA family ATPase [Anaerolineales bacterium]|jgi:AAA15 family ATPase/GTPase
MKIDTFQIKNFRGLKDVKLDSLGSLVVMVGASGAGKTSALEALEIFFSNFDGTLEKNLGEVDDRYWFERNTPEPIEYELGIMLSPSEVESLPENLKNELGVTPRKRVVDITARINYSSGGSTWNTQPLLKKSEVEKTETPEGEQETQTEPPSESNFILADSNEFYKLVTNQFYWIKGSRLVNSTSSVATWQRVPYSPPDVQSQLVRINNSDNQDDVEQYANISKAFEAILPDGCRLVFSNQEVHVLEGTHKFPLSLLGSGQQAFLYLLFEVIRYPDHVIAIEDPGLHLHPDLEKALFKFLRNLSNQVFLITHSPVFLDLDVIENNWIFTKEGTEVVVRKAKDRSDLKSLLDILGSEPVDALYPNTVLIVEGSTEEKVIPIWLRKLGGDPNSPRLRVVVLEGDRDWRRAKEWIDLVKGLKQKSICSLIQTQWI